MHVYVMLKQPMCLLDISLITVAEHNFRRSFRFFIRGLGEPTV